MTAALDVRVEVRRNGLVVNATLEAPAGRTLAMLGPNGAGKSTLVGAIAGSVRISRGIVSVGDRILEDTERGIRVPPEERRVGLMFQDHLLFPHLSVLENVAFPARSQGRARSAARAVAQDWLDRVDIGDLADRRPHQLSGGQAQRVALARTLASDPTVLLLDEPLAALDVGTRSTMRRMILEHLDSFEGPRLVITHDPVEAFSMADTVLIMEEGQIVQTGTPEEIRRRPRSSYTADLAGINFIHGVAARGVIRTKADAQIVTADMAAEGEVVATIHPRAIAIHPSKPEGSPRNVWEATVVEITEFDDRVRVATAGPLTLTAEITPASVDRLGLQRGSTVWVAVKATEVIVEGR